MLGTLRAAPFSRLSYIALLATMALNSSVLTNENNPQDYDTANDFGTHYVYTWNYTT
jgi:hypothetical protein